MTNANATNRQLTLVLESYDVQQRAWPPQGRHILAQFDDQSVIVYQAYRPDIAAFAVDHQRFGGPFSLERMSWVKPNFLWMMYRSGWGTKTDQEVTLAVRLRRNAFDTILAQAIHSSFVSDVYESQVAWRHALHSSQVRLQWDPDHDPWGRPLARRAIQLGLRGDVLRHYAAKWIIGIEDISPLVREQHERLGRNEPLLVPRERVYRVDDPMMAGRLQLDHHEPGDARHG